MLRLSTDVLRRGAAEMSADRMTKVVGAVERLVDRLDRMIGDLLDSESIEAGNVRLQLEDHDAYAIATEIAELCGPTSAAHRIELDVPPGPVPLRCDVMRVEQVLSNPMSNAIKYSPNGGCVSLEMQTKDGDVAFVVRDEGVGMNNEGAARAFEPFRRSATLRDDVPGSGLGLFVVRRLVEAHGGRIDLNTAPGMGSTFDVHIPAAH